MVPQVRHGESVLWRTGCELAPLALKTCNQIRTLLNGQPRSLSEPETDKKNQDKRGDTEPGDHDDFDPHFANDRNIVVHARVAVKESVAIAKDIRADSQIDQEEKCRGDSQSRKNYGIN